MQGTWQQRNPDKYKAAHKKWYTSHKTALTEKRRADMNQKLYSVWWNILKKCTDPAHRCYKNYGARGITICESWVASFEAFKQDMRERPDGWYLARYDLSQGFSPENCYWSPTIRHAQTTIRTRFLQHNGETLSIEEWAVRTGIKANTIKSRLRRHWSVQDVLMTTRDGRVKERII